MHQVAIIPIGFEFFQFEQVASNAVENASWTVCLHVCGPVFAKSHIGSGQFYILGAMCLHGMPTSACRASSGRFSFLPPPHGLISSGSFSVNRPRLHAMDPLLLRRSPRANSCDYYRLKHGLPHSYTYAR